jgi:alpha-beta hydrolase superfamily lysophospholipase
MKTFIENKKGLKIIVEVNLVKEQKGLVFVMHGLSGNRTEKHIQTFAQAFHDKGFTTVLFDTTCTVSDESEGEFEDATVSGYLSDLEDVISWSSQQEFYEEPFYLIGHSLGGICIALYARDNSDKVKGLAPISTVVSGDLSEQTYSKEQLKEWEGSGYRTRESSRAGKVLKLKWSHLADRKKYDLLEDAKKFTMPTLMLVGSEDVDTPLAHQHLLFDALDCEKEFHVMDGSEHVFRSEKELKELYDIITQWVEKVESK